MATQSSSTNKPKQVVTLRGTGSRVKRRVDQSMRDQAYESLAEYMDYLQNRRRLFLTNFGAGMMRGMGFAVGFSILGAVVIYLIRNLALANLPLLGDFFAEVVHMVQMRLY